MIYKSLKFKFLFSFTKWFPLPVSIAVLEKYFIPAIAHYYSRHEILHISIVLLSPSPEIWSHVLRQLSWLEERRTLTPYGLLFLQNAMVPNGTFPCWCPDPLTGLGFSSQYIHIYRWHHFFTAKKNLLGHSLLGHCSFLDIHFAFRA